MPDGWQIFRKLRTSLFCHIVCGDNQCLAPLSINVQVEVKALGIRKGGPVSVALAADPPSQLPANFRLPASFEILTSAVRLAGKDLAAILPKSAALPIPIVLPTLAEVENVHRSMLLCMLTEPRA